MGDHLQELGYLLSEAGARVSISPARVAPSTLYDSQYHIAVVACALSTHGTKRGNTEAVISPALLKFLQFVSARPSLFPRILLWLEQRKHKTFESISEMPRGYIGDRTHDRTINYLLACGVLQYEGNDLASGLNYRVLRDLREKIEERDLFSSERRVLYDLRSSRIPLVALEGR